MESCVARRPRCATTEVPTNMNVERIEFSLVPLWDERYADVFPRPYPALKEIPDWYRAVPEDQAPEPKRSVKHCMPFLEAMTCGYILPLAADIELTLDPAGVLHCQSQRVEILDVHNPVQFQGAPFQNFPVVKITNPWLMRTPPGYSTLFVPLLNRFGMPLVPLAGVVETDLFYREVNFPALLTLRRGGKLSLPAGTPLVQAIPIKRDDFQSEMTLPEKDKYWDVVAHTTDEPKNYNYYKNHFWRKKNYR